MLRGIFVNSVPAVCSLYESGLMVYNALKSDNYILDYQEMSRDQALHKEKIEPHDFYILNWHHITLPINKYYIRTLPGLKIGLVLENNKDRLFDAYPSDIFNTYMLLDPTMPKTQGVYPFPRPLEKAENLLPLIREDIPVIGTFGLFTPGKNFDQIIREYRYKDKEVMIRMNIPFATYTLISEKSTREYCDSLRNLATPNIDLRISNEHMTKQQLISWCSQNSINIFPYDRLQAGLAAASDQAVSSGRGIGVTMCLTFRHIFPYIGENTWPQHNAEELAISTLPAVKKMQENWSTEKFAEKFMGLLREEHLL
jgi:hypothetical protein